MKKQLLTLFIGLIALNLFAQKQITVNEGTYAMSKGVKAGFQTEIPQGALKDIEREWERYVSSTCKGHTGGNPVETLTKGAENKIIYPRAFNIYCKIVSTTGGVQLTAWFTEDDNEYFSSGASGAAAKRFVRDFAVAQYFLVVRSEYKDQRNKLEKLKDDLEKHIREGEHAAAKTTENKRAIARAQDDIATNEADQKEIAAEINLQQAEVSKLLSANGDLYHGADKAIKDLEDDKKHLIDKKASLQKKIDDLTKDNIANDKVVSAAQAAQKQTAADIDKQKQLIKETEVKMKGIK